MPTLKNKKICEDVPPQLDLGPHPSFDSAHLDVPSDQLFPVYLPQNGVKMINEPPTIAACTQRAGARAATADIRGEARGEQRTPNMRFMSVTRDVSQPEMSALKLRKP